MTQPEYRAIIRLVSEAGTALPIEATGAFGAKIWADEVSKDSLDNVHALQLYRLGRIEGDGQ
jgi:hypothetical protein